MEFRKITGAELEDLWELQVLFKAEIGEEAPGPEEQERLAEAVRQERICFYGAWEGKRLEGCCSVTAGFSTFDYRPSGVLEDFYIRPASRHTGLARRLVRHAYGESGVSSLTVGCADCDLDMYRALGFTVPLGNLLAYE